MENEHDTFFSRGSSEACALLRFDLALAVDSRGVVQQVKRPSDCSFASTLHPGADLLDDVFVDDRGAALELLTVSGGAVTNARIRIRRVDGGWRVSDVRATAQPDGTVLMVARDITDHERDRRIGEVFEAILAITNADQSSGVALDAVARYAQVCVPGAVVAVYVFRGGDYELVAAPNMPSSWPRRAFRITDATFAASNETSIQMSRGRLFELGAEFRIGQPWVVVPADVHGVAVAEFLIVAFVGEKRFLGADERDGLMQAGQLAGVALQTEAKRTAGRAHEGTDELTAVSSRRAMIQELSSGLLVTNAMLIHVCGLATINDTYGYDAGDAVLQGVGAGLRASTRGRDLVARISGTVFAVFTTNSDQGRYREGDQHEVWRRRVAAAIAAPVVAAGILLEPVCDVVQLQANDNETGSSLLQRCEGALRNQREVINGYSGTAANDR